MHRNPNALALVSDFGIGMHARDSSTFYLLLSMPSAFYRDFSFFFISNQSFRLVLTMFDTALGGNTSTIWESISKVPWGMPRCYIATLFP